MTTCQTAANEFLRQFWLAIYPPSGDLQTASSNSAAQKSAKAAKMIGYLGKTHEKVDALVVAAKQEGVDTHRVQLVSGQSCDILGHSTHDFSKAMKPILDAVDKALSFWQARSSRPAR